MKLKRMLTFGVLVITLSSACKKTKNPPVVVTPPVVIPTTPTPPAPTRQELSKDSIFLYAKEIYLWNDALPTYEVFNPRKYAGNTELAGYNGELFALSQFKINPTTGKPFEFNGNTTNAKYSYIQDITTKNPSAYIQTEKSSVDLDGNGNDLGLKLGAYGTSQTDANAYALFATAVYQNSPADKSGMVRSDRINKVNGRTIGANFSSDSEFINTAFAGNTITLEGTKTVGGAAGSTYTVTLNKAIYKSSPIYATKVFTAGGKKIGYLAYARFSSILNSKADFDAAFQTFSAAGVTDLIVDLRYNGGGFVNTAQYLIDHIAPATANGSVMFTEYYNSLMQSGSAKILANQPLLDANDKVQFRNGKMVTYLDINYSIVANTEKFEKTGPLRNAANIVFIVSGGTASASELVINSLKPYMNVKIVGTKSYGKPVGFFPVTIQNKYDVYFSLFQTKNSLGQGDYFDGFTPDVVDAFDDPLHNFGDAEEGYTKRALTILAPGAIVTSKVATTMSIGGQRVSVQSLKPMKPLVDGNEFLGMIETKHTLKR